MMLKKKRYNWMLVAHKWHVSSYGFQHRLLCGATEREAKAEAALLAKEFEAGAMPSTDAVAIKLPDSIVVSHQYTRQGDSNE